MGSLLYLKKTKCPWENRNSAFAIAWQIKNNTGKDVQYFKKIIYKR